MTANMAAWNRWCATVVTEGGGLLHPVAHLTLRDPAWLEAQLTALSSAGVRLAMIAPAAVDGRPLSHPDLDPLWAAFVHHGVTPVFHVADQPRVIDDAFYTDPDDSFVPVLESIFLWAPPAIAVTDLIVNGTLARHPGLHIGIVELSSDLGAPVPHDARRRLGVHQRAERGSPGAAGPAPERVLPPPGPGLVLLLRATGPARGQVR